MKRLFIGKSILVPYSLVGAIVFSRLTFNHPYNFVPIFSVLLFFGACRPVREFGIAVLGLIGIDIFITTYHYGFRLAPDQTLTWMWYLLAANLGATVLSDKISIKRIVGSSLLLSVSFFLASNFSVWFEWHMYPRTLSGLTECYAAALPFFRNNVIAELESSLILFALARYSHMLLLSSRLRRVCA
jgi:Family of unknown function (DUF6580)